MVTDGGNPGRSRAVCPEQQDFVWMEDGIESSHRSDKQLLTFVQVPLLEKRPAWCYRGIVVSMTARLIPSFSKNLHLGLWRCWQDKY